MRLFDTILIANRGEIAVRVIRTLRRLGIRSVAVYSDADRDAAHTAAADIAVRLGPSSAADSYLHIERLLDAARQSGAQAIHPGYGFLSENAEFAQACKQAGFTFIGPPASAIAEMGNKIRAREMVSGAGVSVVPGRSEPGMSDAELTVAAKQIGFPVLLKPAAGGGGKGMRVADDESTVAENITSARREAGAAFGDDTLFAERYVTRPRHIEVQVLADRYGAVRHLGERECSLQRRHQKIVEEAPSPLLDPDTRTRIGAAAVEVARAVEYVGAGTVEFVVPAEQPEEFFFLEMNTRLQVEHPVTELVASIGDVEGTDLVDQQIRIAAGAPISWAQNELRLDGHAVEARIYAEDPEQGFLPTGGEIRSVHEPELPHVRVDSGIREGMVVGSDYDPMLAKVSARGQDRDEALARLDAALRDTAILGVHTNVGFLRALLGHQDVRAGQLDTGFVDRAKDSLTGNSVPEQVYVAVALERLLAAEPSEPVVDPWDVPGGWRLGDPAWSVWRFAAGAGEIRVYVRGRAADARVVVETAESEVPIGPASATAPVAATDAVQASASLLGGALVLMYRDRTWRFRYVHADGTTWLAADGQHWSVVEREVLADRSQSAGGADGLVTSPMPGTVLTVDVPAGQQVAAGQRLFVVEAMKMEHTVSAPFDGYLSEVSVHSGEAVRLEQTLGVLRPMEED